MFHNNERSFWQVFNLRICLKILKFQDLNEKVVKVRRVSRSWTKRVMERELWPYFILFYYHLLLLFKFSLQLFLKNEKIATKI